MINHIKKAIKFCLFQFRNTHSAYDGMVKFDFEIDNDRENLMILCFSHLSDLRFIGVCLLIWILSSFAGFNLNFFSNFNSILTDSISMLLFDGRIKIMTLFFILAFVFQWITRWTTFFLSLTFLFLNQGLLHLNLALAVILGILLSRSCLMWWMGIELQSRTRQIWSLWSGLQLFTTIGVLFVSMFSLQFLYQLGFFSSGFKVNRSEFILVVLIFNFCIQLFLASIWGHFYYPIYKKESQIPIRFSTATWFLRIKLNVLTHNVIQNQIGVFKEKLLATKRQMVEFKDQGLGLGLESASEIVQKEINYLDQAEARLTID